VETGTTWATPATSSLLFYFCELLPRVILLVFVLVPAAIGHENYFKINWLWY
jgi:hypothetical protein